MYDELVKDIIDRMDDHEQILYNGYHYERLSYRDLGWRVNRSHEWVRQKIRQLDQWVKEEFMKATLVRYFREPVHGYEVAIPTEDEDLCKLYLADGWTEFYWKGKQYPDDEIE